MKLGNMHSHPEGKGSLDVTQCPQSVEHIHVDKEPHQGLLARLPFLLSCVFELQTEVLPGSS